MAAIELTQANFAEIIENNKLVIVDFWAPWCGPCKSFAPIFEKVSEEHEDAVFAKVNTDVEQGLGQQFQIRSIPTLMVFKEKIIIFSQPGMMPEAGLSELVSKAKELDMDEVRKEIEKQQQQQQ